MTWTTGDIITAAKLPAGATAVDASFGVPTGTVTTVSGFSAVHDPGSWVGSSGITVPTAGLYVATLLVNWAGGYSASSRVVSIISGTGVGDFAHEDRAAGGSTPNVSISGIAYLAAGATVAAALFHDTGSSRAAEDIRLGVARIAP